MNAVIAIPSEAPGGLGAAVSDHFGHCDAFTLIALRDGRIEATRVLPTPPHGDGGCMVPVNLLAQAGVTAIVARGMGGRPLQGFLQSGIQPLSAAGCTTVEAVVTAFMAGSLKPFGADLCCGGENHGDCH
jgi:predicted Fe-Mo cluster-binding NifX family protein